MGYFTIANSLTALPIQLSSFAASSATPSAVTLKWETVSEVDNYGFIVYRSAAIDGVYNPVSALIQGHGTTLQAQSYDWTDNSPSASETYYRLRQINTDNSYKDLTPIKVTMSVNTAVNNVVSTPKVFQLAQNFPNPFNPSTMLNFSVEKSGQTTLVVYNAIGQQVATLYNQVAEAGKSYQVKFDASRMASGMYLCRLSSGDQSKMIRMALVK